MQPLILFKKTKPNPKHTKPPNHFTLTLWLICPAQPNQPKVGTGVSHHQEQRLRSRKAVTGQPLLKLSRTYSPPNLVFTLEAPISHSRHLLGLTTALGPTSLSQKQRQTGLILVPHLDYL